MTSTKRKENRHLPYDSICYTELFSIDLETELFGRTGFLLGRPAGSNLIESFLPVLTSAYILHVDRINTFKERRFTIFVPVRPSRMRPCTFEV